LHPQHLQEKLARKAEWGQDGAVDDDELLTLPAVRPKESYLDVLINPELKPDQIKDLRELVSDYRDIFSDVHLTN